MRRILMVGLVVGMVLGATGVRPARAEREPMGPAASFGWGMAAVGTNVLYIPAKMIYAIGGGLTGLLAWGVSAGNSDVAMGILQPSLSGTWVVTPEMLRGDDPIMFNGPSYEPTDEH
jgi:hypothetical protein